MATNLLEACGGNLEMAVDMHMEDQGGGQGGAGGSGRTTRTRSVQVFATQVGASLAVAFEPSAVDGNAGDSL